MSIKEKLRELRYSDLSFCVFRLPDENKVRLAVHSGSTINHEGQGVVIHPFSTKEADIHYLGNKFIGFLEDWEIAKNNMKASPASITRPHRKLLSREEYLAKCEKAIELMKATSLDKVVLNVVKDFKTDHTAEDLFTRALELYPEAFVHWTSIHGQWSWLGASPELLLKRDNEGLETMSLAGTKVQGDDLMTSKEHEEQGIVTTFITKALKRLGVDNPSISDVSEKKAGHLVHLCNRVRFNSQLDDSVILEELHPTPAVCGYPRDMAIDTLKELGMMDRDYYCGFIGFRDATRSEYYVNLRCMEIEENSAYVFVGGGITDASSPEQEWEEMNQKALTMGRILE